MVTAPHSGQTRWATQAASPPVSSGSADWLSSRASTAAWLWSRSLVAVSSVSGLRVCPDAARARSLPSAGPLRAAGQLAEVALPELAELGRVVPVPRAQFGGRRDILGPVVQPEGVLAQAARPTPVDEHPGAVRGRRLIVDAADPDIERRHQPHLPEQIYPYSLTLVYLPGKLGDMRVSKCPHA